MRVEADGRCPSDLMLVGESPGWEEVQLGKPFVGKSGQQLWSDLRRHADLGRGDFYITNLIKDGLPNNRDPKPEEIAAALPEFIDEVLRVRPKVIVTAGAFATHAVLGRWADMALVHGIPHTAEIAGHVCICHPTYHPAAGLHNKGVLAAFAYDLGRLRLLLDDELGVWAPSPLPAHSHWLIDRGRPWEEAATVALDTEGWSNKPWGLSLTVDGKTAYVAQPPVSSWLSGWIARQSAVVLHNGIHDLPVLAAMGVTLPSGWHDTQVLAYHDMLRTGSGVLEAESQNLGTLAYRECGLRLRELSEIPGVDFATQTIPYRSEIRDYAGMDAIATWRLFDVYRRRGLVETQPYQIDMGQVALVEKMMRIGLPFDTDAAVDYYANTLDTLRLCTQDLQQEALAYGLRDFNPGSHPQVRELLTRKVGLRVRKRTKGGQASTSEKALADHREHPLVKRIQDHRELVKLKGTYLEPLLEELL